MTVGLLLTCLVTGATGGLDQAREHLLHGRYAEAAAAYSMIEVTTENRTARALGLCRAYVETGRYEQAATVLEAALEQSPKSPRLLGRRAEISLLTGDLDAARDSVKKALALDSEQPAARWVKAELLSATGQLEKASRAYRWFVRFYNRAQPTEPATLRYVALGSLQYARWNRVPSVFRFVVNTLCPDIEQAAPDEWRAAAISGALLLEKYNEAQGRPELQRTLAINPRAADVHAALASLALGKRKFPQARQEAKHALATNPNHLGALGVLVDIAIIEGDLPLANTRLEEALAVRAIDQELIARKVGILILAGKARFDDLAVWLPVLTEEASPPEKNVLAALIEPLLARNPRPGRFLAELGRLFESRRRFDEAERLYRAATVVMPQLAQPKISLGLLSMRDGNILAAEKLFEEAFQADPFNVRVHNVRKVIDLLKSYDELRTEHFTIRYDPGRGQVLAELAAMTLEEFYPKVTSEFGYEPAGPTVVEIFSAGEGASGHEWFSARMIGLPWLHTIGASTGMMLAMAQPTRQHRFNWAETLRHEFVHVVTLQQTDFQVPHWYTEALAVRAETFPRPELWNELLRQRVPAGEIASLNELNKAFIQPESSKDWNFAYCQSLFYAQYIDKRFGSETHREILAGYAAGGSTKEVFAAATGVSIKDFEAGYRASLQSIAAKLGPMMNHELDAELEDGVRSALGVYHTGETDKAIAQLESLRDEETSQPILAALIGRLLLEADRPREAAKLFAEVRHRHPQRRRWLKLQAAALMKAGGSPKLIPLLEKIAQTDADDVLAAKRLAELAVKREDFAAAKHWAIRALHVSTTDAELHKLLAKACEKLGEKDRAAMASRHAELCQ